MAKLRITEDLELPLDVITMRLALYGTTGAGKTTFARLLAEKVFESKHRFCAIDLKNDWWGLKSSADGGAAGIPVVIFGGPRKDVQLFDDAGTVVADTVAAIDQSVVIDLDAFSKGKQLKFLAAFLERLYDVNREPLLLIADEADRYAPQKPMTPEAIFSLGASEDICRRGRKRGIGSIWATQRTAVINKNVSEFCDLTVVFRTPGTHDLKELEKHVGRMASKEQLAEVMRLAPGLDNGQALFLSSHPKLRGCLPNPIRPVQLPMPWTFDSSQTPGLNQRRREPKTLAKTDLAAIEAKMAQQLERAKADDPKELRKTVTELRKQLAARPSGEKIVEKEKVVEVPVLKNGQLTRTEKIIERVEAQAGKLEAARAEMLAEVAELKRLVAPAAAPRPVAPKPVPQRQAAPAVARAVARKPEKIPNGIPSEGVSQRQQRFLDAAATLTTLGAEVSRETVAAWVGVHPRGGSVGEELKALEQAGLIVVDRGRIQVTEAGMAAAGELDATQAIERAKAGLSARQCRFFEVICEAYPETITREAIAEQFELHPRGGSLGEDLGRLVGRGLVEGKRGEYRAREFLFVGQ